ncbi:hypothetical protein GCM10011348_24810 [Marinobacterium nitratireducens]|uniref:Uncharacterized protein n=1 Tax=Marinobacterium nitratireducens TaxID=518897 RepID=A0A917ZH86_9GAMM|nr:hypothetical protein [Marinobacterium nitratireducens]GGO82748.1 hypothetical protein GCM10011348_24810 [Marinobacterium nitratireducens]
MERRLPLLLLGWMLLPVAAAKALEYRVVPSAQAAPKPLPQAVVVPYSSTPSKMHQVEIGVAGEPGQQVGEDAVFERIRRARPLERCLVEPGTECDLGIYPGTGEEP